MWMFLTQLELSLGSEHHWERTFWMLLEGEVKDKVKPFPSCGDTRLIKALKVFFHHLLHFVVWFGPDWFFILDLSAMQISRWSSCPVSESVILTGSCLFLMLAHELFWWPDVWWGFRPQWSGLRLFSSLPSPPETLCVCFCFCWKISQDSLLFFFISKIRSS